MTASPPEREGLDHGDRDDDGNERGPERAAEEGGQAGGETESNDQGISEPRPARDPRPRPAPYALSWRSGGYVTSLNRCKPAATTSIPASQANRTSTACSALIEMPVAAPLNWPINALAFCPSNMLPIHL